MCPQPFGSSLRRLKEHRENSRETQQQSLCLFPAGVELFSKLGENLYFQGPNASSADSRPSLFVVQFQSSTLDWRDAGLIVHQTTVHPTASNPFLNITLVVRSDGRSRGRHVAEDPVSPVASDGAFLRFSEGGAGEAKSLGLPGTGREVGEEWRGGVDSDGVEATISVRIPTWAGTDGLEASLNGGPVKVPEQGRCVGLFQSKIIPQKKRKERKMCRPFFVP